MICTQGNIELWAGSFGYIMKLRFPAKSPSLPPSCSDEADRQVNCAEAEQTAHEIIVEVRDEIQSVKELNDYFRVAMKPPESRDIVAV